MTIFSYPNPPTQLEDEEQHRRLLAEGVARINSGKTSNVLAVTLAANEATTVITDVRITAGSYLGFMPETANAAAELGNGTLYVADGSRVNGSATISHANNAQTDRTYRVVVIG